MKEDNWNLEMQLQDLKSQISKSSETMTKMTTETGKLQNDKISQVEKIEALIINEETLKKEVSSWRSRYEQESTSHRKMQDQYENETNALHKSLNELQSQITLLSTAGMNSNVGSANGVLSQQNASAQSEYDVVTTPDNSPPLSPVKATPSRNSALEAETIKSTLGHANRMVNSLKSTLLKEKSEKLELKRQISDLQLELNATKGSNNNNNTFTSNNLRNKRSKHFAKRPMGALAAGGMSMRGSSYLDSDSEDGDNINNTATNINPAFNKNIDNTWRTDSESESYQSAFETAPDEQPTETEDDYQTGQETMDEDSAVETETEDTPRRIFTNQGPADSSTDEDDDAASQYTRNTLRGPLRSVRSLRSQSSFVAASPDSSRSIISESTPVKQSNLASEFLSIDEVQKHADSHGLVTLSMDEYDELSAKAELGSQLTPEQLPDIATTMGFSILPVEELNELKKELHESKSKDFILHSVQAFGLAAIPAMELERLSNPSTKDIYAQAKNKGCTVVESKEYDKLIQSANHKPSKDEVMALASSHGLVALPVDEHKDLVGQATKELTEDDVIRLALSQGLVAIPKDQFDSFSNPTLDDIRNNALKQDHVVVSQAEYDNLLRESAKTLDKDELQLKAKGLGLVLLSDGEHQNLANPGLPEIKGFARAQGHRVLSIEDYEKLSKPDQAQLNEQAAALHYTLLSNADYEKLIQQINRSLTKEELEVRANEFGLIAIPKTEYFDLVRFSKSPSLQELKDKGDEVGVAVIPKAEFNQMLENANTPSLEYLQSKATALNSIVVDDGQYKELKRMANNPTPEELQTRAIKLGFVALPDSELKTLKNNAMTPSREHLEEKASSHNALLISQDEYNSMKNNEENPSKNFLQEKSKLHDALLVSQEEYYSMKTKADSPSIEHLSEKANMYNHKVIPNEEYLHLQDVAKTDAESRAAGMISIAPDEHAELLRQANNPNIEEVKEKAISHGLVAVPDDEIIELRRAVNSPTVHEINTTADKLGMTVISKNEYNRLASPSLDDIKSIAQKNGLIALPSQEYQKMTEKSSAPIDETFLKSAAAGLGLSLVASSVLESFTKPPVDKVHQFASQHGRQLISTDELKSLKNPSKSAVKHTAEKHGFTVLDPKEYSELTKDPTRSQLETYASAQGLVTLPIPEYNALTAELSKDDLIKKVQELGLVAVGKEDYNELKARPKDYNPTSGELQEHAKLHNLVMIPVGEHDSLMKKAADNLRSREKLEEIAPSMGLSVLASNELQDLRRKTTLPTKSELDSIAAQQGYAVVSVSGLDELHRKAEQPDEQDLETSAKKLGFTLIKLEEIREVRRRADEPSLDEIKNRSLKFGHELLPNSELDELRRKATSPSKEELVISGEAMNLKVIPKEWYEELEKNSTEPDEATITKFARRVNLSVISTKDLEDLQRKADKPSQDDLEMWGRKLGLVVLSQEQYSLLERAGDNKPVVAKDLSSVMAKRDHFEDIIKQSSSPTSKAQHVKVVESIKSLGYVPVSNEEYKRLLENQNVYEPSRGDILRAAKTYGLVCIAADEYRSLLKKNHTTSQSISSVEAIAIEHDSPVSGSSRKKSIDQDTSFSSLEVSPSKIGASEVVMKNVPAEYLASLRRIAENPNKEDLSFMATKLGLVLAPLPEKTIGKVEIPSSIEETVALSTQDYEELCERASKFNPEHVSIPIEEYNRLQVSPKESDEQPLTVDDVEKHAKLFGLKTITISEFDTLKEAQAQTVMEPSKDELEHYAQKFGLVTLPVTVYEELISRRPINESLPEEELRSSASNSGMILIDKAEYTRLTTPQIDPQPVSLSSDELKKRAKEIGLVVLSSVEFSNLKSSPKEVSSRTLSPSESLVDRPISEIIGSAGTVGDVRGSSATVINDNSPSYNEQFGTVENVDLDVQKSNSQINTRGLNTAAGASESDLSDTGRNRGVRLAINDMTSVSSKAEEASTGGIANAMTLKKLENNKIEYKTMRKPSNDSANETKPVDYLAEATANAAAVRAGFGHASQLSSAATIASQTSLNDRNMIAYITQVVIGEFLFKYTRKIGVTGISENRHERFFWIHPYTLTLYWSDDNPAVESHRHQKTRSAAILGIRSIEDRNPLPPGLHYKSLVIQAPGKKEIRVTCPNRQRHNIWYNSIQYLLKRSTDDLDFEDAESNDDYVQDSRFERERARTSGTQNGRMRVQSIRRSMAPEMNTTRPRASSRQASIGSFNIFSGRNVNDDASSRASSRLGSRMSSRLSGRLI